jgi:hypothetical protein
MKALLEFDEKEFWIQLFSIAARREERTEGDDVGCQGAPEMTLGQTERSGASLCRTGDAAHAGGLA